MVTTVHLNTNKVDESCPRHYDFLEVIRDLGRLQSSQIRPLNAKNKPDLETPLICLILGSGISTVLTEYQPQLAYDDKQRSAGKEKGINIQLLIERKLPF